MPLGGFLPGAESDGEAVAPSGLRACDGRKEEEEQEEMRKEEEEDGSSEACDFRDGGEERKQQVLGGTDAHRHLQISAARIISVPQPA